MNANRDIPPQFESIRDQDEEILWAGTPSFLPYMATGIPFLIIGILWGAIDYYGVIRHMSEKGFQDASQGVLVPFLMLHLFPFWGSILNMFRLLFAYGNTRYAITSKRLMYRGGFLGIDIKAIDYDKIVDLEVNVNPLENLFGVGTIRVFSGSVSSRGNRKYDSFIAILNPYEVFKQIKEVSVDIKTDWNFPNAMRPAENPGYRTKYDPDR